MENTFKRENHKNSSQAKVRNHAVSFSVYFGIIFLLVVLIFNNYASNIQAEESASRKSISNLSVVEEEIDKMQPAEEQTTISPEEVLSANLAATVATNGGLSSSGSITSHADSLAISSEIAQTNTEKIDKNNIANENSAQVLINYKVKSGDTVKKLAKQFSVSAQTIRWANDLVGDEIAENSSVVIPTVDGVVYTVQDGDKLNQIARKYRSDSQAIIALNDIQNETLRSGTKILLPGGILPENERPTTNAAPVNDYPSKPDTNHNYRASIYAGNRYAYGNCTWYAYNRRAALGRPIGSFWGNANTWDESAISAGFSVDKNPSAGSILQDNSGYYGHVAIVEKVNPNGSIVISEMNYAGGWGVVSSRKIVNWQQYNFIH